MKAASLRSTGIIEQYRAGLKGGITRRSLTRDEAAQRIEALGFTEGDAKAVAQSKTATSVNRSTPVGSPR